MLPECFSESLQQKCQITNDMIHIAENIQTIHNSFALDIPPNTLSTKTSEVETGNFKNTIEDNEENTNNALLASIGELIVNLTKGDGLKAETTMLDIQFGNKEAEETILQNMELKTAFEECKPEDNSANPQCILYKKEWFCSPFQNLNNLAMQTTI
jgi:hypothetical protein